MGVMAFIPLLKRNGDLTAPNFLKQMRFGGVWIK